MLSSPMRLLAIGTSLVGYALSLSVYSDQTMQGWLDRGGAELAIQAAPMFFFGQAMNHPPCYPTTAVTTSGNVAYQAGSKGLCPWPDTGCNCRNPGIAINNYGPTFPTYYTYQKCSAREVRVAYNLFYEKDGFSPSGTGGHAYDWENVIIRWYRFDDATWRPDEILLSGHGKYTRVWWNDIQNTFNHNEYNVARGGSDGRKNLDHPKIYIAWSKHAHFHTRNTGYNDIASQLGDNAFRSQDWWHFPQNYIRADMSTFIGQAVDYFNWGDADSDPVRVHSDLCSR